MTRVAAKIHIACGGHDRAVLKPSVGRAFLADVVKAADVDLVVRALGRAYRRRGHRATGWFPRAQPASPQLSPRTPERISVGRSRVDLAVRHLIEEVAGDGPLARRARLRDVASRAAEGLFDALEPAMARIGLALPADQAWWAAVPYLRWASLVSATAGFALLAGSGSGWNDLSQILIGVGVIGWMSAATASTWATARTSTRAQQSAKLWLTAVVEDEARSRVLVPLTAEIEAWRECQNTAREARGVSP